MEKLFIAMIRVFFRFYDCRLYVIKSMNLFFFYKYINLTLFIFLGSLRTTSSAALGPIGLVASLYNATDKIVVLESQNFSSTVYNSNTAWLVEFYASWCGHCVSYANVGHIFLLFQYFIRSISFFKSDLSRNWH